MLPGHALALTAPLRGVAGGRGGRPGAGDQGLRPAALSREAVTSPLSRNPQV